MRLHRTGSVRVLGFDLESRPSSFWYGDKTTAQITAFGWKWEDEPDVQSMVLLRDGRFDFAGKKLGAGIAYGKFTALLASAGLVYGHNIREFDLPLLQAGLLRRQMPILKPVLTTDTLKDFPRRKDMPRSLDYLSDMYELDAAGKMHMGVRAWERSNDLEPEWVEVARRRVTSDVVLQERLRARLLELNLLRAPRTWLP